MDEEEEASFGKAVHPGAILSAVDFTPDSSLPDLNSLLETGSVIWSDEFGICDDEMPVPLSGVVYEPVRAKHSSRQRVLGSNETMEQEPGEERTPEDLVDVPPANAKLKFVDVPRVARSAELPSLLSRVQISQCPDCFNLSDECNLCEESSARAFIASYSGAADPTGGNDLPEWSTYSQHSGKQSEKHALAELNEVIRQVEDFQADGCIAKITERLRNVSVQNAIQFCVDSGASDHICSQIEAFET